MININVSGIKKKVKNITINVGNVNRKVKSVWVNKGGVVSKVFNDAEDIVLIEGQNFYRLMTNKSTATNFTRANSIPDGVATKPISTDNVSVVTWYDSTTTTQYWYSEAKKIYLNPNCLNLFRDWVKITSLDLSDFNASKVTSMEYLVGSSLNLTRLKFSDSGTSNVTSTSYMFDSCDNILDIINLDTSNVIIMKSMFGNLKSSIPLDLSNLNTSKVADMKWMFLRCNRPLNLLNFNTSNVMVMEGMFYNSTLTDLDLSSFDMSNVTNTTDMFINCLSLKNVKFKNIKTDISFSTCPLLNSESIKYIFNNAATVENKNFNITGCKGFDDLRAEMPEIVDMLAKGWNIIPIINYTLSLIDGKSFVKYINENAIKFMRSTVAPTSYASNVGAFKSDNIVTWYDYSSGIQYWYSEAEKVYLNPDSSQMFYYLDSLKSLSLSGFDSSNVANMYNMFGLCTSLTTLDISSLDTSNVVNMSYMFSGCYTLNLDVSNLNTSKVTNMDTMFSAIGYLYADSDPATRPKKILGLNRLDTSKVTNMRKMFGNCTNLIELDIPNFNTSNVTNMEYMFCSYNATRPNKMATLILANFDTSKVINMQGVFADCVNLQYIIYGENFNNKSKPNTNIMFRNCPANKPSWWIS